MREIGTVFATFLGIVVLKEKQGTLRILCSVVILIGILTISFGARNNLLKQKTLDTQGF